MAVGLHKFLSLPGTVSRLFHFPVDNILRAVFVSKSSLLIATVFEYWQSLNETSTYGLKDKVVVVTGAGSGIGEAIAIEFAKQGSRVVVHSRTEENANKVSLSCDQVSPFNYQSLVHVGDLTEENVCEQLIQKAVEHFKTIDVLVNNAGSVTIRNILEEDYLQHYDYVMNLNTRVPLKLSRLSLPYLITSKGCIVNISSISAYCCNNKNGMHYSMSKAALDAMTKNLACEFGPKSVRVVSINPGWTKTNIHKGAGLPETIYDEYTKNAPLQRPAEASEIANAVCFAASSAASFITGTNIAVDGGYSLNY